MGVGRAFGSGGPAQVESTYGDSVFSITYGSAIRLLLDLWIGTALPVQQKHEDVQFKRAVHYPNFLSHNLVLNF